MAKYKVKDINKNGKIDSWEQAKYDAINKSSDSPAKHTSQKYGKDNEGHYHYKDKEGKPISRFSTTPVKQVVDPTMQQQMVKPMTNIPPAASSLVNPFSPQAQANAQGIFGNQQMKQNAVNAPCMYKKSSPLDQKLHDEKGNFIGNTEKEQARLFNIAKGRASKEYKDWKVASGKKYNWEDKENDYGFGNKVYPKQREVDSLRSVYEKKFKQNIYAN